jgi:hypothetical protein
MACRRRSESENFAIRVGSNVPPYTDFSKWTQNFPDQKKQQKKSMIMKQACK